LLVVPGFRLMKFVSVGHCADDHRCANVGMTSQITGSRLRRAVELRADPKDRDDTAVGRDQPRGPSDTAAEARLQKGKA